MITQLQTISGCVFNLQWLRGQSDIMLAKDVQSSNSSTLSGVSDMASVAIAAKDETIAALRAQLTDKDALIQTLQQQIADLQRMQIKP